MTGGTVQRLAADLGGTHATERVDGVDLTLHVAFGEFPGCEYTVVSAPDAHTVLEFDYSAGAAGEAMARRLIEDAELSAKLREVGVFVMRGDEIAFGDDQVRIVLTMGAADARPDKVAPLVRRMAELVTLDAPPRTRHCWACGEVEAELQRREGDTVRWCPACSERIAEESRRLEEAYRQETAGDPQEGAPFTLPEDLDTGEWTRRSRQLEELYRKNPSAYWTRMLSMVGLGQAAMAGGMVLMLLLVGSVIGLGVLAFKIGFGALLALKLLLAKGAKLVLVGLVAAGVLGGNLLKSLFAFRAPPADELRGVRLDRSSAPKLFAWLDGLADRVDAPRVDLVLLDRAVNAWASERRDGRRGFRRVVGVGFPVLDLFDREELESIMAHELGHLRHKDARTGWVYRTAQSWTELAWRLAETEGTSLFPRFARWYVPRFMLLAGAIRREQERAADEKAAAVSSKEVYGRALVKVATLGQMYGWAIGESCRRRSLAPEAAAASFDPIDLVREGVAAAPPGRIADACREALEEEPHWLDSHPVLEKRLADLGVEPPDPAGYELTLDPADPASSVVDRYAELRRDALSAQREMNQVRTGGMRRASGQRRREIERLRAALAQPASAGLVRLARNLFQEDEDEEALETYTRALQLAPDHQEAMSEKAEVLIHLRRYEEAADVCAGALAASPDDVPMMLRAVTAYEKAGRSEAAVETVRKLLGQGPPPDVRHSLEEKLRRLQSVVSRP